MAASFLGIDPASAILFAVALLAVVVALLCVRRAIGASSARARLVWLGRALALVGAAIAVSFPATLYQEIVMLADQGRTPTYDIARAIWYETAMMPLVALPAAIALRWPRLGGALFVLTGVATAALAIWQPFGVIYPESRGWTGAPVLDVLLQPAFVTAALLLAGSSRVWAASPRSPRPARSSPSPMPRARR
jgi:hypothetical protein